MVDEDINTLREKIKKGEEKLSSGSSHVDTSNEKREITTKPSDNEIDVSHKDDTVYNEIDVSKHKEEVITKIKEAETDRHVYNATIHKKEKINIIKSDIDIDNDFSTSFNGLPIVPIAMAFIGFGVILLVGVFMYNEISEVLYPVEDTEYVEIVQDTEVIDNDAHTTNDIGGNESGVFGAFDALPGFFGLFAVGIIILMACNIAGVFRRVM